MDGENSYATLDEEKRYEEKLYTLQTDNAERDTVGSRRAKGIRR